MSFLCPGPANKPSLIAGALVNASRLLLRGLASATCSRPSNSRTQRPYLYTPQPLYHLGSLIRLPFRHRGPRWWIVACLMLLMFAVFYIPSSLDKSVTCAQTFLNMTDYSRHVPRIVHISRSP